MRILHLAALAMALAAAPALALDSGARPSTIRDPSPNLNRPVVRTLDVPGGAQNVLLGNKPLSDLLLNALPAGRKAVEQSDGSELTLGAGGPTLTSAITSKAPIASPVFTGTVKAPAFLGDLSGSSYLGQGTVMKTLAERDRMGPVWRLELCGGDPTGVTGSAKALEDCVASAPYGATISGIGQFLIERPVTLGGKALKLAATGGRQDLVFIIGCAGGITFDQRATPYAETVVQNVTWRPSCASIVPYAYRALYAQRDGTAAALDQALGFSAFRAENDRFQGSTDPATYAAPYPNHFRTGGYVQGGFFVRITGPDGTFPQAPRNTVSAMYDFYGNNDSVITEANMTGGHAIVRNSGRLQGMTFINPKAIGTDWLFAQEGDNGADGTAAYANHPDGGFSIESLTNIDGEISTYKGGISLLYGARQIRTWAGRYAQRSDSVGPWAAFDLTDSQGAQIAQPIVNGVSPSSATLVRHRYASRSSSANAVIAPYVSGIGTLMDTGSNTFGNSVERARTSGGVASPTVTDSSGNTTNRVSWIDAAGVLQESRPEARSLLAVGGSHAGVASLEAYQAAVDKGALRLYASSGSYSASILDFVAARGADPGFFFNRGFTSNYGSLAYSINGNGDALFHGLTLAPGSSATPAFNGAVTFELTNNSLVTIRARGTDGVVRSGVVNLTP